MGNDLKYGLVLGAVVLLIFVGYYAIRSQGGKEEIKPPVTAKKVEPPKDVNIFEVPGTAATTADTVFASTPTATYEFGPAASTVAPAGTAVAPLAVQPAAPASTYAAYRPTPASTSYTPAGTFARYTPPSTVFTPGTGRRVGSPAGTGLAPVGGGSSALDSLTMPPTAPKAKTYKIARGDTLGEISKKFYGTTDKWQKIMDANKDKKLNPNNLVIGTEITIPDVPAGPAAAEKPAGPREVAGAPAAGKTHTVGKNDTLYSIAKQYYGDGTQWKKIYEANKSTISNPNVLKIGTVLNIP
jgi:nucleoid-associated protein YgaU